MYCECCGKSEDELEPHDGGIGLYTGEDAEGRPITEYLCEFCAKAEMAAGIAHTLIGK